MSNLLLESGSNVLLESGSIVLLESGSSPATTATLTGPTTGAIHYPSSNFTVTLNGSYTGTITPSDSSAGGTFTPSTLSGSGTFTYTPSTLGNISISISASPSLTYSGSPITFDSLAATIVLSGPSSITVGQLETYTITILSSYTGTLTPSDSLNEADINPNLLTLVNATGTYTFTLFTTLLQNRNILLSSSTLISVGGSPLSVTASQGTAKSIILSNSGFVGYLQAVLLQVGTPSTPFVLTPNGYYTGTVTFSDLDPISYNILDNGSFNPTSITFNNSNTPQSFTYTANSPGSRVISVNAPGLTINTSMNVVAR
jgi:hypothetical protein